MSLLAYGLNCGLIGLRTCPDPPELVILTTFGVPWVSFNVFASWIVLSSILMT